MPERGRYAEKECLSSSTPKFSKCDDGLSEVKFLTRGLPCPKRFIVNFSPISTLAYKMLQKRIIVCTICSLFFNTFCFLNRNVHSLQHFKHHILCRRTASLYLRALYQANLDIYFKSPSNYEGPCRHSRPRHVDFLGKCLDRRSHLVYPGSMYVALQNNHPYPSYSFSSIVSLSPFLFPLRI